jgi:pilus assembly protein Flp/PilA
MHPRHRVDLSHVGVFMKRFFAAILLDDTGGQVMEYALIAGLIVVAAVAVISSVGGKVLSKWTYLGISF